MIVDYRLSRDGTVPTLTYSNLLRPGRLAAPAGCPLNAAAKD